MADELVAVLIKYAQPVRESDDHSIELDLPAISELIGGCPHRKCDRSPVRRNNSNHEVHDRQPWVDITNREDRTGCIAAS